MGLSDLWLIVEGRDHDRVHYDRLLQQLPSTKALVCEVRLAEEIQINGASAGGKAHVVKLHDLYESSGLLVQASSTRTIRIAFMLDRDRDDFSGQVHSSKHVIYTHGSDVETDILLNSNIWLAIEAAYGIDSSMSRLLENAVGDPPAELLQLWKAWLLLSLVALDCGVPGMAPWAQLSRVNIGHFGAENPAAVTALEATIRGCVGPPAMAAAVGRASNHVASQGVRLLKGRWIAKYAERLVRTHLFGRHIKAGVSADHVIDTALSSIVYSGPWFDSYEASFAAVLQP